MYFLMSVFLTFWRELLKPYKERGLGYFHPAKESIVKNRVLKSSLTKYVLVYFRQCFGTSRRVRDASFLRLQPCEVTG